MAITRLTHHDDHQVSIHLCKPNSAHYAALRCVDCNKHIQWLDPQQAQNINEILNPQTSYMGIGNGGGW